MHRTLRLLFFLIATSLVSAGATPQDPSPPKPTPATAPNSIRFAVLGDQGTGKDDQYNVARQMVAEHDRVGYGFVLLLGDNLYGGNWPKRRQLIFDIPYKPLLDRGVLFYATLGNHDQKSANEQTTFTPFNMYGKSAYSFKPAGDLVEFFTYNSTPHSERADRSQLAWLDSALAASTAKWKIAFSHHPPYSPGSRHGDDKELVATLVPILVKHGVQVVMTGHEHFFAKLKPVDGVHYLISGSGGKIHPGGIDQKDPRLEYGIDTAFHFVSVKLSEEVLEFTVIDSSGKTLYTGSIPRVQSAAAGGTLR
jgi:hypothetical protein